jgi:hypothetical protein
MAPGRWNVGYHPACVFTFTLLRAAEKQLVAKSQGQLISIEDRFADSSHFQFGKVLLSQPHILGVIL